ncbi:site-specific integrase [Actinocorallia longicatena]|uniref:Phage integrase family protein n=1 Tax=Actinocorallia longicatena TaxID=111803 RepID=A0ABP6QNG4_9ACTN
MRKIPGSVYPQPSGRFRAQEPRSRGGNSRLVDTEPQGWAWLDERDALYRLEALGILPTATRHTQHNTTLRDIYLIALTDADLKDSTKAQYKAELERVALRHAYADIPLRIWAPFHVTAIFKSADQNHRVEQLSKALKRVIRFAEVNYRLDNLQLLMQRSEASSILKRIDLATPPAAHVDNVLTLPQLQELLAAETNIDYRRLWTFFATSTARIGEVIGMAWPRIDLPNNTASVTDNVTVVNGKLYFSPTPKNNKPRAIFYGERMTAMIQTQRTEQDYRRKRLMNNQTPYDDRGWVSDVVGVPDAGEVAAGGRGAHEDAVELFGEGVGEQAVAGRPDGVIGVAGEGGEPLGDGHDPDADVLGEHRIDPPLLAILEGLSTDQFQGLGQIGRLIRAGLGGVLVQ